MLPLLPRRTSASKAPRLGWVAWGTALPRTFTAQIWGAEVPAGQAGGTRAPRGARGLKGKALRASCHLFEVGLLRSGFG